MAKQEPLLINEIVSLGKTVRLKVSETNIQELMEEHGQELSTDGFILQEVPGRYE